MSLTIRELYQNNKDKFHLKSLTGEMGFDYTCTWVHMAEDSRVTEFFWGNEMVVSSGYGVKNKYELRTLMTKLIAANCTGILFNIGPYLKEIPKDIIDFCVEHEFALFTMPWEMSMTEFVRDCCMQITKSMLSDEDMANAIMHVVHFPEEASSEFSKLSEGFSEQNGCIFVNINIECKAEHQRILEQRNTLRIHTAMRAFNYNYLVFKNDKHFVLIINTDDKNDVEIIASNVRDTILNRFADSKIYMGIGEPVQTFSRLNIAFHTAIAARRHAELIKKDIVAFSEMDFYRLLYMVPDKAILEEYYRETMAPLLAYEEKTHKEGIFTGTLFAYLLTNGSLQMVSKMIFTHENTVYYRLNKIREIIDCDLKTVSEREKYIFAYYCGVITGLCEAI